MPARLAYIMLIWAFPSTPEAIFQSLQHFWFGTCTSSSLQCLCRMGTKSFSTAYLTNLCLLSRTYRPFRCVKHVLFEFNPNISHIWTAGE